VPWQTCLSIEAEGGNGNVNVNVNVKLPAMVLVGGGCRSFLPYRDRRKREVHSPIEE
jgi:hypothetical protein